MHFPAQPDQLVWPAKDLKEHALGIRVAEHLINSYSSKWFQIAQSKKSECTTCQHPNFVK